MAPLRSMLPFYLGAFASVVESSPASAVKSGPVVKVPKASPPSAGIPLDGFVSYSIEWFFFPDYAGNSSHPNHFSNNLLNNLGDLAGTKPYIRVGGNTQDYAIFDKSLDEAVVGTYEPAIEQDYPLKIKFGPAFFESLHTWPDTKYIYGMNLASNTTADHKALLASIPYACKALQDDRLLYWELGNEPDLYKTSAQGIKRPSSWNEQDYVDEWQNLTQKIRSAVKKACPEMAKKVNYKYYAPSFAGTANSLDPIVTWEDKLDQDKDIAIISSHNYISGATSPGVTLQHTLMNHTSTVASVALQLNESRLLAKLPNRLDPGLPFILGETNSLYNQGRPGLSNSFGAALWGVDFNLWCATNNISRVHMHQGVDYSYQAWQPVDTANVSKGTKAPYYGNIAVASFLGNISASVPSIVNLPLPNDEESAYAAYNDDKLSRLIVINMMSYNATEGNPYIDHYPRPKQRYEFFVPRAYAGKASVQWLMANGSDAITGCTFDGYSYNYELENGKPVRLHNVTVGQTVEVGKNGKLVLDVPRSSAAIVRFDDM